MQEEAAQKEAAKPLWLRAGSLIGAALIASALASLPAALRMVGDGAEVPFLHAWAALAGVEALPAIALVALFRAAGEGLRALSGDAPLARALATLAWVEASLDVFARLGSALRAKTHHHALAGATFALVALAAMLVLGALAARLAAWSGPKRARVALVAAVVLSLAALLARAVPDALGPSARASLVDGTAALFALVLAATLPQRRALVAVAPLAALAVAAAVIAPAPLDRAPLHALLARPR